MEKEMTFFGKIAEWLKKKADERKARRAETAAAILEKVCCEELQVKEWNGGLYICHYDVPIIKQDMLSMNAVDVLKASRTTLKAWKEGRR